MGWTNATVSDIGVTDPTVFPGQRVKVQSSVKHWLKLFLGMDWLRIKSFCDWLNKGNVPCKLLISETFLQ